MLFSSFMLMLSIFPLILSLFLYFNNIIITFNFPIISFMFFQFPISIILDWVSCLFLMTVMMISSSILMYSMYYMPKKEHKMFCILLLMFVLSMSILIISNNLILILLGWDGLGLSSYILVIYYQNHLTASSGSITLLSNRIGDIMILLSMGMLIPMSNWNFILNKKWFLLILLLLLIAACSKSAQFPFSAWLPMAMAAPTPISALVHSSTLVTAGTFLMIRIFNSPHPNSMLIMMIISSMTAIYASLSANWEQDLKKIIALSTLSQMAMIMFAISINSISLAFFHLITHAFFKSTMFLCAGNMIHESSYQDMRMMGMNMNKMPLTFSIMSISNLTLLGAPFLSGFLSKDAIIEKLISSKFECFITLLMISSMGMTTTYAFRMMFISSKFLIKSKPDLNLHLNMYSNLPIMILSPTAIFLGSCLLWSINPKQYMFIPFQFKMMILLFIMLGMMSGIMFSFNKKNYMKLSEFSLSLWFTHFMTTLPMMILSPLMTTLLLNDKYWQEMYGPKKSFFMTSSLSSFPEMFKTSLFIIIIMLVMIPIMFIS